MHSVYASVSRLLFKRQSKDETWTEQLTPWSNPGFAGVNVTITHRTCSVKGRFLLSGLFRFPQGGVKNCAVLSSRKKEGSIPEFPQTLINELLRQERDVLKK